MREREIIVVGAGGLLGASIVSSLHSRGIEVVAVDISPEKAEERIRGYGCNVPVQACDITSSAQVKEIFDRHPESTGLVNASYPRNKAYGAKFLDVKGDDFNENISLHLGSAFLIMQEAARSYLDNNREFSLLNIASIYGVIAPKFDVYDGTKMTMPVEYAAIKSAILHLTKYVSKFVSRSDFRVNSISPGGIFDSQDELFLNAYKAHTHGTGMLMPSDFLDVIYFLLSSESRYITGQNIIVDDGFTL